MEDIKILIVEDEAIVALDLQERLTMMGFHVCGTASSGEKAILLSEKTNPDLVLMDMKLKGNMNGIDTANIIKEKLGIPSIFLTAFSDESTLEKIKRSRNNAYLSKPFDDEDIKSAIERLLNNLY